MPWRVDGDGPLVAAHREAGPAVTNGVLEGVLADGEVTPGPIAAVFGAAVE
jgi:hypothetical protein